MANSYLYTSFLRFEVVKAQVSSKYMPFYSLCA